MRTMLRSKVTLLFLAFAFAIFAVAGAAMALTSPTITSDKSDYAPGELVTLTGSGWQAGESVHIVVNDDEGQTWSHTADVTADGSGSISDSFNLPDWFVATYTVTATGSSGTATTSFTDGQVRVQAVGTAGAKPLINWTRYSSTNCTGTVVDSGSFSADTTDPGTTIQDANGNMNLTNSQSLKLTAGSVNAQHTFSSWSGGDFTTGTFTPTSNPGCLEGSNGALNTDVNYANQTPVADPQTVPANVNPASKLITLSGSDADNDALSYKVTSRPANGTLYSGNSTNAADEIKNPDLPATLAGTDVTFKPNAGFTGSTSFKFLVSDGSADSTEATVTINVTSDNTAPTVTVKSAVPATIGANSSSTITWNANENGNYSVRVGGTSCTTGTVVASGSYTTQPNDTTSTVTASALSEGANTVRVCVTDAANNTGSGTITVTKDTIAPSAPAITSPADNSFDTDGSVTVSGTAEPNSTVELFDNNTSEGTTQANATTGAWSKTLTGEAVGSHPYTAKATDAAGNTSGASNTRTVIVDTQPPAKPGTPDLDPASDTGALNNDNVTKQNKPTISGTAEPSSTIKVYVDGNLVTGTSITANATTGAWSYTFTSALGDAPHSIKVTATDAAGHTSVDSDALSVTIDTAAPSTPSIPDLDPNSDSAVNNDNVTNDDTPKFNGTADADSTVSILVDGVEKGSGTATGGNYSITTTSLDDNTYSVTAKATDLAGNPSGASSALSVTIDTVAPDAPPKVDLVAGSDTGVLNDDNVTNDDTPTFDVSAEAGSKVKIFKDDDPSALGDGLANGLADPDNSGNKFASVLSSTLQDGTYAISATATDLAGNESASSADINVTVGITVDTAAPNAPTGLDLAATSDSGTLNNDNVTNDNTPTINGKAEPDSYVELFDGATSVGTDQADSSGDWSITSSALSDGQHTSLTAKATDAAGNPSGASSALSVTIDTGNPVVSFDANASAFSGNPTFDFGSVPAKPSCSATDTGGSGVLTPPGCVVDGYGTAVNSYTLTAKAKDIAGNEGAATPLTYTVRGWNLTNLSAPVDYGTITNNVGSVPNTVKNGSTVPLKFEVFKKDANKTELTDPAIVNQPLTARQVTCDWATSNEDPIEELSSTNSMSVRYDATGGQFIYNWQTPKKANTCYLVSVSTKDGSSTALAKFKLK